MNLERSLVTATTILAFSVIAAAIMGLL